MNKLCLCLCTDWHGRVQDSDFHPAEPLVATGVITGRLHLLRYDPAGGTAPLDQRLAVKAHTDSCRSLRFTPDGALLLSASADRRVSSSVA